MTAQCCNTSPCDFCTSDALDLAPNDRPSRIFLDRCRYYQINPPDDASGGVWIMQEK